MRWASTPRLRAVSGDLRFGSPVLVTRFRDRGRHRRAARSPPTSRGRPGARRAASGLPMRWSASPTPRPGCWRATRPAPSRSSATRWRCRRRRARLFGSRRLRLRRRAGPRGPAQRRFPRLVLRPCLAAVRAALPEATLTIVGAIAETIRERFTREGVRITAACRAPSPISTPPACSWRRPASPPASRTRSTRRWPTACPASPRRSCPNNSAGPTAPACSPATGATRKPSPRR